jgi:hypothetical protein
MESKLNMFASFQIYSLSMSNNMIIMVDHLWIEDNRVFFRIVEAMKLNQKYFRKEDSKNIYSINKEELISIRCRFYF